MRKFELSGCFCCDQAAGVEHCPNCHSVGIHQITEYNYTSVVNGIPVYWGTDQAAAVRAARAGAGYVTVSPILLDFRQLADDPAFQPVLATPFGDAPVPLDAVRQRRLESEARPLPRVLAGVADGDGPPRLVDLSSTAAPTLAENRFTRPPESTQSVGHADTVALPRYGDTGP